jgi:hypothetical protein
MLSSQPSRSKSEAPIWRALTASAARDYIFAQDMVALWIGGSREVPVSS